MSLAPREILSAARRVVVLDFGGLGDHIHSLPSLWLIRQSAPQAELHVVGTAGFYGPLTPWIAHTHLYVKRGLRGDLAFLGWLRGLKADAVIAITGSNHACAFAGLSGAALRVARKADANKRWRWQPWLLNAVVDAPYHEIPMYRSRWNAFRQLGLDGEAPEFPVAIDTGLRRAAGVDKDGYLHLSASASDDRRDLPMAQMIALWNQLHARLPQHRIVVSGNATVRGRERLATLVAGIAFKPWRVFDGTLDVPAFLSVMQGAVLHVGPDSGGLHVARVAGTPSVSWFRPNHHLANWFPDDPERHLAFVAPESRDDGLYGIATETLVEATLSLLPATATVTETA
ncbi:glycosyltransferase family 9 protein [Nevskia ramosa]|uniref:glycosyltransferase family 9 protein n=1 Tax=Nevskia ramosa TaxID=64002 RepID=UPI003D0AAD21